MASFVRYDIFSEDLSKKVHDFYGTGGTGDVLKVALSNTTPVVGTQQIRGHITEIGTGNGYAAGGTSATAVGSRSGGTFSVAGTDVVFTASGGTIGPFRYAVLYNDTPTSPADPLIGYWDYGTGVTLQTAETFTVDFGATMFTVVGTS